MLRARSGRFPTLLLAAASLAAGPLTTAAADSPPANPTPKEGPLEPFLGTPILELAHVFDRDRFPNVVVATDGSVLAVWGGVGLRRSTDGGRTWGEPITIAPGFMGGGVTVDEVSGDVLAFVEEKHPPAALAVYRSKDHGLTWKPDPTVIYPNSLGHVPSMHMNDHGITLRHGRHAGRLVRPSRWYGRTNYPKEFFPTHYTNAIFSDDGGRSWKASEPFPEMGTGEACVVELADGRLLYNTRRHWAADPADAVWRWTAESTDGGLTWVNQARSAILPDGDPASTYGLMGGLVRLPVIGRDILVFSNIVSPKGRKGGHVWASFDGGRTWPVRREVFPGAFAYSSLDAGRPGTPSAGWIYLLFEGGPKEGGTLGRFNLTWLVAGEATGDGTMPDWIKPAAASPAGSAAKPTAAEAEAKAATWLDRLGDRGLVLDATLAEPGFVVRQGDSAVGRVTKFELDQEGYRVSFTFRGAHTAATPPATLREQFWHAVIDRVPTPGFDLAGWETRPLTPSSSFDKGVELVDFTAGRATFRVRTEFFAISGRDPTVLVPADAPSPPGSFFQLRRPFPLELTLSAPASFPE